MKVLEEVANEYVPLSDSQPFFYPFFSPLQSNSSLGLVGCVTSLCSDGPGNWENVLCSPQKGVLAAATAPSVAQEHRCSAAPVVNAVFFSSRNSELAIFGL